MRNYHKKFTDMLLMHLNTNFILLNLTKQIFGSCFNTYRKENLDLSKGTEKVEYHIKYYVFHILLLQNYIELITFFIKEEFLHKRHSGSRDSLDQVFQTILLNRILQKKIFSSKRYIIKIILFFIYIHNPRLTFSLFCPDTSIECNFYKVESTVKRKKNITRQTKGCWLRKREVVIFFRD